MFPYLWGRNSWVILWWWWRIVNVLWKFLENISHCRGSNLTRGGITLQEGIKTLGWNIRLTQLNWPTLKFWEFFILINSYLIPTLYLIQIRDYFYSQGEIKSTHKISAQNFGKRTKDEGGGGFKNICYMCNIHQYFQSLSAFIIFCKISFWLDIKSMISSLKFLTFISQRHCPGWVSCCLCRLIKVRGPSTLSTETVPYTWGWN